MELNLTKLRVLTQYNKQYRYSFLHNFGITGYLRGHISRESFFLMSITSVTTLRTQFHIRAQHPLISH